MKIIRVVTEGINGVQAIYVDEKLILIADDIAANDIVDAAEGSTVYLAREFCELAKDADFPATYGELRQMQEELL